MAKRGRSRRRTSVPAEVKALTPQMAQLAGTSSGVVRARQPGEFDLVPMRGGPANLLDQFVQAVALPRDLRDEIAFGPRHPLAPQPVGPVRPDSGQQEPWISEYPVAWNLPGSDHRFIPWRTLRDAADQIDIFRRCIELRKDHITALKWAFTVTPAALDEAYRADPGVARSDLASTLREKWAPEIARLTAFWANPWKSNGIDFRRWIRGVMEERLVFDAVVVYPQCTFGGDCIAMNLIDGSTIKPLLDYRGARPLPPFPAFQQNLYGFPRGEYRADITLDELTGAEQIDNGYVASQLYYQRESFRTWTPYGQSPTEQALSAARVYMRRQGWMLSEYDDGVLPEMLLRVPEATTITPNERRRYEDALNDELSGQTKARHRGKILFPGMEPTLLPSVDERYKADYDLFLIKRIASFYGVSMTSLGFTESKGLGSAGMHEAQADSEEIASIEPDKAAITGLINDLSASFLRMPAEIGFDFVDDEGDDTLEGEQAESLKLGRGSITLNDDRRRLGQPVFSFPEADMPYLSTQTGPVFFEGSYERQEASAQATQAALQAKANPQDPTDAAGTGSSATSDSGSNSTTARGPDGEFAGSKPGQTKPDADQGGSTANAKKLLEFTQYKSFLRKGRSRPFEFVHLDPDEAVALLKAEAGEPDPKAQPPAQQDQRWPGWTVDAALAALVALRIKTAMAAGLDIPALVDRFLDWTHGHPNPTSASVLGWLRSQGLHLTDAVGPVIREAMAEAWAVGEMSAQAVLAHGDARNAAGLTVSIDWRGWKPGDVKAARRILAAEGNLNGLQHLLDEVGATIEGMDAYRLELLATALADGLERGSSPRELGVAIEGLLTDENRAYTVAWTETNRAMSAAALDTYRARDVSAKEWLTAHDQRVCPICKGNEAQGAIPIDNAFASGEPTPPGHPRCRCALIPARLPRA